MRVKLIILGLFLFASGFGTLGWFLNEEHLQQKHIESLKLEYGSQNNDYLKQYNDWVKLPDEERVYSPFALDKDGRPQTAEQIRELQELRLQADIDELIGVQSNADVYYDILYGENWQQTVEEYRKQKEENEIIRTVSSVCGFLGSFILCGLIIYGFYKLIVATGHGFRLLFANMASHFHHEDPDEKGYYSPHSPHEQDNADDDENENEDEGDGIVVIGQDNEDEDGRIELETISEGDSENITPSAETRKLMRKANRKAASQQEAESSEGNAVAVKNPKQIDHTLLELTKEVSAIREYAATQQNRLQKLQDGYDWNIIKTFCLRIIRCIDNIENRIETNKEQDTQVNDFEEIRDELVFALESSGVERFEPKINSEFRGQEKFAEAVKTKKHSGNSENRGKIEKVLKPGYKCFIDDENVRVVRPAQVRVFG